MGNPRIRIRKDFGERFRHARPSQHVRRVVGSIGDARIRIDVSTFSLGGRDFRTVLHHPLPHRVSRDQQDPAGTLVITNVQRWTGDRACQGGGRSLVPGLSG